MQESTSSATLGDSCIRRNYKFNNTLLMRHPKQKDESNKDAMNQEMAVGLNPWQEKINLI
ncbi:MAG: hypothetical protein NT007_04960 [Candidatus Kapabacteria bacterium]|nr:hypothetical protein [Candidatus Kapabacteria bacterium]